MKDLLAVTGALASAGIVGYGLKTKDKNEKIGCIAIGALGFLISGYVLLRGPKAVELSKVVSSKDMGCRLQHGHLEIWGDLGSDKLVGYLRQYTNKFTSVKLVDCPRINDNAVKVVATSAPRLTSFAIDNCSQVGNNAIVHIFSRCPQLTSVCLNGTRATRQSLQNIPGKVTALTLGGSVFTDADVKWLANKKHITFLTSTLTRTSKEAYRPLRHLKELTFKPRSGSTRTDVFSLNLPARIKTIA